MQLRNTFTGKLTRAGVVIGLIVFALLFLAVWSVVEVAFGADSAASCLTKEQARAKWRTEWIYWHGANHCWDNVRGTAATANKPDNTVQIIRAPKPNRATKADKSLPLDASGNATARSISPIVQGPVIYYPELMGGSGTSSNMLTPSLLYTWQPVTDFDIEPVPFTPWSRARPAFDK
jgi:hypothetical protein